MHACYAGLRRVYPADIAGTVDRAKPRVAARMLADTPDLLQGDPYLACAIGDTDRPPSDDEERSGLGQ